MIQWIWRSGGFSFGTNAGGGRAFEFHFATASEASVALSVLHEHGLTHAVLVGSDYPFSTVKVDDATCYRNSRDGAHHAWIELFEYWRTLECDYDIAHFRRMRNRACDCATCAAAWSDYDGRAKAADARRAAMLASCRAAVAGIVDALQPPLAASERDAIIGEFCSPHRLEPVDGRRVVGTLRAGGFVLAPDVLAKYSVPA